MPDVLALAYPTSTYPYSTGFASITDVQARVSAGSWDPANPTAYPNVAQVNAWLAEGTANIDAALGTRGYYVPLQPRANWTPPTGMPAWNGIGLGAWLLLRHITAAYATSFVEASRHTGSGRGEDLNSTHWMTVFDDFLTRLETAADNLAIFGVGGIFAPEIDPAAGADTGSLGTILSNTASREGPVFTRSMNLGGGWETSTPPNTTFGG